jgi:hypothetical protein
MPLFPLTCRLLFPVTSRLQASQEVRGERSKYERFAGKVFTFFARLAFWRVRRQQRHRPKCDQSEPVLKASILPAACEEVETALGPAEVPPDLKLTCVDRKPANEGVCFCFVFITFACASLAAQGPQIAIVQRSPIVEPANGPEKGLQKSVAILDRKPMPSTTALVGRSPVPTIRHSPCTGPSPSSRRISLKTASLQACEKRGGLFFARKRLTLGRRAR